MEASPSSTPDSLKHVKGKVKKKTQLKKWFVAKICEYSRGRQLLHVFSGNVGVDVIDAAQSIVAKHSGKEVAADIILQIYKVVCKAGVLVTEKEITDEMMRDCKQPNLVLLHCLVEQLEAPVATRDTAVLLELLEDCYSPLNALLARFEGSAPKRLERLRKFVVESDVLSFFLTSGEADVERELILRNVREVIFPYQADIAQVTQVMRRNLQSRQRELLRLLVKPSLADFLRSSDTFTVLCNWFASNRELASIHWLYFYKSAKEYSTLTSRHLMSERASQIQKKYLLGSDCNCPVVLPPIVLEKVCERIELDEVAPGLFSEALAHTLLILKDDFTEMFSEKKHFEFLQVELMAVESKLSVLSGGGGVTSTLSLLRTDVDGNADLGIEDYIVASSTSLAPGDDTVSRMSFWN